MMDRSKMCFDPTSLQRRHAVLYGKNKRTGHSWNEHFLSLSAVSEAIGGADDMLLESVIKYANPDFEQALMALVNTMREDTRRQAEELCHFDQLMDSDTINNTPREAKSWTRYRTSAIRETKPKKQINCSSCGKSGYMKRQCRNKSSSSNEDIILGIGIKRQGTTYGESVDFREWIQQAPRDGCRLATGSQGMERILYTSKWKGNENEMDRIGEDYCNIQQFAKECSLKRCATCRKPTLEHCLV
uniref:AlNc14C44G3620 protein n=1 Tax=Albugo laibachii Nc14 TaxID=890382 RepID=F0WA91_9STRA|nr:AlNc14C44G3620 [Albugo laibachii Nc14]|eukprot:CCA18061.1 AlNc14C44G3620 [Albugo laibachii Nc14]